MHKLITLPNGGGVISLSPMTDEDIGLIIAERESRLCNNLLDGTFDRQYNPASGCKLKVYVKKQATSG